MSITSAAFTSPVRGSFFRAIDPQYREYALAGSRSAGRYSRDSEPTLYLSSSPQGVEGAMRAHRGARSPSLEIVRVEVEAARIVDLRDESAVAAWGIDVAQAMSPWQDTVAAGGIPPSWGVRDRLIESDANGLIDPSRQHPGLWHLVLFRWNEPDAPLVRVAPTPSVPLSAVGSERTSDFPSRTTHGRLPT